MDEKEEELWAGKGLPAYQDEDDEGMQENNEGPMQNLRRLIAHRVSINMLKTPTAITVKEAE